MITKRETCGPVGTSWRCTTKCFFFFAFLVQLSPEEMFNTLARVKVIVQSRRSDLKRDTSYWGCHGQGWGATAHAAPVPWELRTSM